jgi:flagellin-like hook-associated protein FlgL
MGESRKKPRRVPEWNIRGERERTTKSFANFCWKARLNLSQQENSLVGADLATVASNFAQAQVANQATLNATARVLGLPTLLDFLK